MTDPTVSSINLVIYKTFFALRSCKALQALEQVARALVLAHLLKGGDANGAHGVAVDAEDGGDLAAAAVLAVVEAEAQRDGALLPRREDLGHDEVQVHAEEARRRPRRRLEVLAPRA